MKEKIDNIKLGLFITIGTICFVLALYYIGAKQNLFGNTIEIRVVFNDVNGLQKGNNVRFSGIDIGTVKEVEILNDTSIQVKMLIDKKVQQFIKQDAIATLGNDGLMGNKLININPGSPHSEMIKEGELLHSVNELDTDDMLRQLEQSNRNIGTITESFVGLVQKIEQGDGVLGKLISDSSLSEDLSLTMKNLRQLSTETAQLSKSISNSLKKIESKDNTLGLLLNDTSMANDLKIAAQEIRSFSKNTDQIMVDIQLMIKEIQSGKGAAGTLLTDSIADNNLKQSLYNLENGTNAFNKSMEALQNNILFRRYFKKQERDKK